MYTLFSVLCPFYSFHATVIFVRISQYDPNDVLDIENLSNSSDSCTPNIIRQSVPPYPHSSVTYNPSLSISFQLRLPARQQDRVSRVAELDGGGVPGASDHQLGCYSVGQQTLRVVGCPSHLSYSVVNRGFAACLPRVQGTSSYSPEINSVFITYDIRLLHEHIILLACLPKSFMIFYNSNISFFFLLSE